MAKDYLKIHVTVTNVCSVIFVFVLKAQESST